MLGLMTSSRIGFSGALVHMTQSLRGSSWARMARTFSRTVVSRSGLFCRMLIVSLAVTASIAGRAAEKQYEEEAIRW